MPPPFDHAILDPRAFAAAVPALAHRPLLTICGCLQAIVEEVTLTPMLCAGDACYLITPAFVIPVTDPAAVDEHSVPLFRPVAVAEVAALLNRGFTPPWTAMALLPDGTPAVAHHTARQATEAAATLTHALRSDSVQDPGIILPALADITDQAAASSVGLAAYCGEHTPHAENQAVLAGTLLRTAAQQLHHLRDEVATHPITDDWPPTLTHIAITANDSGIAASGSFQTIGRVGNGQLTCDGHTTITSAVDALLTAATQCGIATGTGQVVRLSATGADTPSLRLELEAVAHARQLTWQP